MRDPFPQVDGAGFEKLRAAGIEVESGLMEAQARALNRGFLSRVQRGRPWLRVKLATSLDGRSALANGESKWISGEASRLDVQHWRARSGAIVTGAGTVLADDPASHRALCRTTRPSCRRCAWCWIPDWRRSRAAACAKAMRPRSTCTRPMRRRRAVSRPIMRRCRCARVGSISTPCSSLLAERGVNEIQLEAGATLAGAFLSAGLVDEVLLYVAPVLLGERARPMFDGLAIDTMTQKLKMSIVESRYIGQDVRLLLRPDPQT